MKTMDAVEEAYKNGYEDGKRDAVKHGRWNKDEKASENHVEAIYVCSACQNWEAWGETEKTNYCPNCGARMDGGDNG